jgi:hypothetical protein
MTGNIIQGGSRANTSGNTLEASIGAVIQSKGFEVVNYKLWEKNKDRYGKELLLCNVPYETIYGHNGKTEFVLLSEVDELEIRIECKWQQSAGSVDEKYPYLYMNCMQMPEEHIFIIIDGGGAKDGAVEWLRSAPINYPCNKSITVFNLVEFLTWANKMLSPR